MYIYIYIHKYRHNIKSYIYIYIHIYIYIYIFITIIIIIMTTIVTLNPIQWVRVNISCYDALKALVKIQFHSSCLT